MTDARALRAALLALHRELLEAQRIQAERFGGRMSAGEVLQAAADDLRFDWLRVLSQLIAELDEALVMVEHDRVDAVVAHARGLLAPPDAASAFGARYLQAYRTTLSSSLPTATSWRRSAIHRAADSCGSNHLIWL
ncbi:MAG TPA: hypothetical protein VFY45_15230 [Baekduia sp.]|nr:hypothetical protein [Baekduia sp.]